MLAAAVCFIACHAGPADHFAVFSQALADRGYEVQVMGAGPAAEKFQSGQVGFSEFQLDDLESLLGHCALADVVVVDVGDLYAERLLQELGRRALQVLRLAYYDNPEVHVSGEYDRVAARVIGVSDRVAFANANLGEWGIGYYPLESVERMKAKRASEERDLLRQELLAKEDWDKKVIVYMGGNNSDYFDHAFPAFLDLLEEGSEAVIFLQQHPGARGVNRDGQLLEKWKKGHPGAKVFLSSATSEEMQVIADGIVYRQTSMAPQFALAGIPLMQIGPDVYEDLAIREGWCSVITSACELQEVRQVGVVTRERLGFCADWQERLEKVVQHDPSF